MIVACFEPNDNMTEDDVVDDVGDGVGVVLCGTRRANGWSFWMRKERGIPQLFVCSNSA